MPQQFPNPEAVMRCAVELAGRGLGYVEPNPPVGAVVVDDDLNLLGEGYHERFGGPHAEVNALRQAGERAAGGTLFVTLEPCCHVGKTGPCTQAVLQAGIRKVVVAMSDPAPHVAGGGIAALRAAGVEVEVGLLARDAAQLTAPFLKRVTTGLPWVHAKWAMTLDGKIATRSGHSQWISNEASRAVVHRLRGRMDAIVVGSGTALADDPLLTARPPGPRVPLRIVLDSHARLPVESRLVRTLDEAPLLVVVGEAAPKVNVRRLRDAGVEILQLSPGSERGRKGEGEIAADRSLSPSPPLALSPSLNALLAELGRRKMTNVLVEGGGRLLGALFDRDLIDEVHVFVAPKLVGGAEARTPLAGLGLPQIPAQGQIDALEVERLDGDLYLHGLLRNLHPYHRG